MLIGDIYGPWVKEDTELTGKAQADWALRTLGAMKYHDR